LVFEPAKERGSGYEFETRSSAVRSSKEYIPGVEKGLASLKETGVIAASLSLI
jgi:hypothetical protein